MDTLYMNSVALIVLLGIRWNTALLFEGAAGGDAGVRFDGGAGAT
ncbi:MAG: monovalent cation/H+ antiporter complex subunit F [Burkholderiaceae bacterium]